MQPMCTFGWSWPCLSLGGGSWSGGQLSLIFSKYEKNNGWINLN